MVKQFFNIKLNSKLIFFLILLNSTVKIPYMLE